MQTGEVAMDEVDAEWQQIPAAVADQESFSNSVHLDLANHESIRSTTIIRENYIHIDSFPPNHHEGLPISEPPSPPPLTEADEPSSVIKAISGVLGFAARYPFWKVASVVGAASLALVYVKMQRWWWLRPQKKGTASVVVEDKFRRLIKERDQRIHQLLLQIAHMNEMLMTKRRVHVVRVG